MIRELQKADIDKVADIWLNTNVTAHYFISKQYWQNNFELVKELLLQATVYVYEQNQEIQGFIGLNDAKNKRNKLFLNVYQKNIRAIAFYQREGFEIQHSGFDESTKEKEYVMAWQRK